MVDRYMRRETLQETEAALKLASRVTVIVYQVVNVLLASDGLSTSATDQEIVKALATAFYERMSDGS